MSDYSPINPSPADAVVNNDVRPSPTNNNETPMAAAASTIQYYGNSTNTSPVRLQVNKNRKPIYKNISNIKYVLRDLST